MIEETLEQYLPFLEDSSMSHDEKMEHLGELYKITQAFVDLGFSGEIDDPILKDIVAKMQDD